MSMAGRLTTAEAAREFVLAGNATVTLVSQTTGGRYTYKVRKAKDADVWFVSVMYGPDNEGDFAYMGTIFPEPGYKHGRKSKLVETDRRELAFRFFWSWLTAGKIAPNMEVWHEGSCGRCGRKLTVPESIERGIGPECAKLAAKHGGHRHDLEAHAHA